MPYLAQRNQQGALSTGGGGAPSASGGGSFSPQPQGSGAYSDLSGYLSANGDAAKSYADRILNPIQQQATSAQFMGPDVSYPDAHPATGHMGSTPGQSNMTNGSPQTYWVQDSAATMGAPHYDYTKVNNARSGALDAINSVATPGGLTQRGAVGGYTDGERRLDSYLLNGVGAQKQAEDLRQRYSRVLQPMTGAASEFGTSASASTASKKKSNGYDW